MPSLFRAIALGMLLLTLALGYAGGFYVAYGLMALAIIALIILLAGEKGRAWPNEISHSLFLAAFALLAVAFSVSNDLLHALNFTMFVLYGPIFVWLSRQASPSNAANVSAFAAAGGAIAFAVAAYQVFILMQGRAESFGSDPIWSAQAAVVIAFLALLGVFKGSWIVRIACLLGAVLAMGAVVSSGSRGPILAIPPLMVVALIYGTRRWPMALALVAVVGLAALAFVAWLYPQGLARITTAWQAIADLFSSGRITENSAGQRQIMYQAGIAAFLDKPWFGHGWENRVLAIGPYLSPDFQFMLGEHHHLHSDGLDFAVTGGITGLLAYLLVLIAPPLGALLSPRDSQYRFRLAASSGLALAYAIFGVTYLAFGYEYHTTLYVLFAAIILGFCRDRSDRTGIAA